MAFNHCNQCNTDFPGPNGAKDFVEHVCVHPVLRQYFHERAVKAGKIGGKSTSEKKSAASRANAKKARTARRKLCQN